MAVLNSVIEGIVAFFRWFDCSGRRSRRDFWHRQLWDFSFISLALALGLPIFWWAGFGEVGLSIWLLTQPFVAFWMLGLTCWDVRLRLHDSGRSGWWLGLGLPSICWIIGASPVVVDVLRHGSDWHGPSVPGIYNLSPAGEFLGYNLGALLVGNVVWFGGALVLALPLIFLLLLPGAKGANGYGLPPPLRPRRGPVFRRVARRFNIFKLQVRFPGPERGKPGFSSPDRS